MRRLLIAGMMAAMVGGCGGGAPVAGKPAAAKSRLQQRSSEGFMKRLAQETGEEEVQESASAEKIGRALALAKVDIDVATNRSESPTPGSKLMTARVEEVATDYSWVTAAFEENEAARPSVGDWAAVVERTPPDNTNRILEIKRDMVMAYGRVLELQGGTVKVQLDEASVQPRIRKGQDVIIRWY